MCQTVTTVIIVNVRVSATTVCLIHHISEPSIIGTLLLIGLVEAAITLGRYVFCRSEHFIRTIFILFERHR